MYPMPDLTRPEDCRSMTELRATIDVLDARLVAMLARRGFGQSMAYDVVSAELAGERERRRV